MAEEIVTLFVGAGLILVGIVGPVALTILLAVWLVNKKRRDELMIERLVEIKERLDSICDDLERGFARKE